MIDARKDPKKTNRRSRGLFSGLLAVVEDICRSRFVFCQSLHGAIVAHAYGIPWAWWKGFHGRWATFKWEDWFASIGVKPAAFRLGQLAEAERWAAKARARTPDLVALRQALVENVSVANLHDGLERLTPTGTRPSVSSLPRANSSIPGRKKAEPSPSED